MGRSLDFAKAFDAVLVYLKGYDIDGTVLLYEAFHSGRRQGTVVNEVSQRGPHIYEWHTSRKRIRTTYFCLFYQRHAKCSCISSAFICG